jgi:hypothetical protein
MGLRNALAEVEVAGEVAGGDAACLLDLIYDMGLVHEAVLAEAEQRFQVIRQELAANVDSAQVKSGRESIACFQGGTRHAR